MTRRLWEMCIRDSLALHDAGLAHCVNAAARPVADFDIVSEGLFGNHVRLAAEYLIQPVKHGGSLLAGDGLVRTEGAVLVAGDNAECGGIVPVSYTHLDVYKRQLQNHQIQSLLHRKQTFLLLYRASR